MDYSYYNAVDQIYHSRWSIKKFSRQILMRRYVSDLFPDMSTNMVQVAGTSGKGSVCRFLEAGFPGKSGSLTGPHLFDFRERFSIDNRPVSRNDITEAWQKIRDYVVSSPYDKWKIPTFTEITLLIALYLFKKYNVKWAAVETSVGGRYTQAAALDVKAAVLTNVGDDHEHLLGEEKWQRALDKAGICRKNIPLFTTEKDKECLDVIRHVCDRNLSQLKIVKNPVSSTKFRSEFQGLNAALSIEVLRYFFDIDEDELAEKFSRVKLPGRFQEIRPGVIADIAHNPQKMDSVTENIRNFHADKKVIYVLGLSGKRLPDKVFSNLHNPRHIIVTRASSKSVDVEKLAHDIDKMFDCPVEMIEDPKKAYLYALTLKKEDSIVILTGSAYMIDQALNEDKYMRHLNRTYGWRNHP